MEKVPLNLGVAFVLLSLTACRFDPFERETITNVPVEISLEADRRDYYPEQMDFSRQWMAPDGHILSGGSPSNVDFNQASVASFQVTASNGARYSWSLRGPAIQRQYDRITLNIPNMPVGPAQFDGVLFLNPGGIPNEGFEGIAAGTRTFSGVWRTAGPAGGSVPIDISSSGTTTQLVNIPLVDAAQGTPQFAHSNLKIILCNDGTSPMNTNPTNGSFTYRAASASACNAGVTFGGSAAAISATGVYARFRITSAYTGWTVTSPSPMTLPYMFLAPGGPTIEVSLYCNGGTCPGGMTTGDSLQSCPIQINSDLITPFSAGSDAIFLWVKKSGC